MRQTFATGYANCRFATNLACELSVDKRRPMSVLCSRAKGRDNMQSIRYRSRKNDR